MEEDAYTAFDYLSTVPGIDASKIAVMGVSKGGLVAINTALAARRRLFSRAERDFAAHISLVPPCHMQQRDARSNGQPILVMLAGRDDYTGTAQAEMYIERIKAAGRADITSKTYSEALHAWEATGKPVLLPHAENYSGALFWIEDDGRLTDAANGQKMTPDEFLRRRRRYCTLGAHAGGGTEAFKLQVAEDILGFLDKRGISPIRATHE
jgi:dienelactone hydrolase